RRPSSLAPTRYNATTDAVASGRRLSVHLSWKIRPNAYFDSIDLMRVAEQARRLAGVSEVAVVMGTPTGRAMLAEAAMWPAEAPVGTSSDLLMAVRASDETSARRALAGVEELLGAGRNGGPARAEAAPRTTASAARGGTANVALVAVPGDYAALDAHQALSSG